MEELRPAALDELVQELEEEYGGPGSMARKARVRRKRGKHKNPTLKERAQSAASRDKAAQAKMLDPKARLRFSGPSILKASALAMAGAVLGGGIFFLVGAVVMVTGIRGGLVAFQVAPWIGVTIGAIAGVTIGLVERDWWWMSTRWFKGLSGGGSNNLVLDILVTLVLVAVFVTLVAFAEAFWVLGLLAVHGVQRAIGRRRKPDQGKLGSAGRSIGDKLGE